jgi:hypothetical protein
MDALRNELSRATAPAIIHAQDADEGVARFWAFISADLQEALGRLPLG